MKNKKIRKIIYNAIILALLAVGATYVIMSFAHFGNVEYTDNATVRQHISPVNTRVQGFIKRIYFSEFQYVHKGDTLAVLEDSEFRLHVAQAQADLSNALAGSKATSAGIATTSSNINVNDAAIDEAAANLANAKREFERFTTLYAQEAATRQQYDNEKTAYTAAKARYAQLLHARQSTSLARVEQSQHLSQDQAGVEVAQAALRLARINLSYTVITAPCDGVVGRKDINEGQLVQPGQTLVNIVDSSDLWIVANYRETQMRHISVGAAVDITADAVPGVTFHGTVQSISDATGATYSMIPQDNATGNFVKVEQRIPVRICIKRNAPKDLRRLRAGLNVECEVKY